MSVEVTRAEVRELIDRICDQFESQWRTDVRPRMEDFLARVALPFQPQLLAELLPLEFEIRARAGETPLETEYAQRFPAHSDTVALAFQEFLAWVQESTLSPLGPTVARARPIPASEVASTAQVARESSEETANTDAYEKRADSSVDSAADAEATPQSIGRYRIVRRLGQGGMGIVYLAHDPSLDRQVALKLPFLDPRDPRAAARRFAREARAMAAIHHANLCPIFDVGEIDGRPFLTMAFIDGQTLAERLAEAGRMPPQLAARIVATLAQGVQTIHEAGIVHRDLKPTNVLVDRRGGLFITDFGLASSEAHDPGLTSSGMLIGSPAYMAPEQIETRDDPVGPHSDVYALGVILYELLCGRRPFDGSGLAILGKVSSGERPPPPSRFAPLPAELEAICLRAIAFRAGHRHASAACLAAELLDYLQSAETVTARSESTTTTLRVSAVRAALSTTHGDETSLDGGETRAAETSSDAAGRAASSSPVLTSEVLAASANESGALTKASPAAGLLSHARATHGAGSSKATHHGRNVIARGVLASVVMVALAAASLFIASAMGVSFWGEDESADGRTAAVDPARLRSRNETESQPRTRSPSDPQPSAAPETKETKEAETKETASAKPASLSPMPPPMPTTPLPPTPSPTQAAVPPGGVVETMPQLAPGCMWVLGLDGKSSYAYAPSLSQRTRGCVTVEAWVAPQFRRSAKVVLMFGGKYFTQIGTSGSAYFAIDNCAPFPPGTGNPKFEPGEWAHVAAVSDEDEVRMYVNGVCGQRVERMATPQQAPHPFEGFWIGGHPFAGQIQYHMTMLINEVRVSKTARYADDFKPSRRLETDSDTLTLLHCDEGDGVLLRDSSGHEHNAQVTAPQWVQIEKPK